MYGFNFGNCCSVFSLSFIFVARPTLEREPVLLAGMINCEVRPTNNVESEIHNCARYFALNNTKSQYHLNFLNV
jgi:hypothetical protein